MKSVNIIAADKLELSSVGVILPSIASIQSNAIYDFTCRTMACA